MPPPCGIAPHQASAAAKDPLLSEKTYWLNLDQAVAPTNEAAFKLNFVGIGFEAYFNPLFASMFKCTYTDAKKNKVCTPGRRGASLSPEKGRWTTHAWRST